jgi:hypothetical protein
MVMSSSDEYRRRAQDCMLLVRLMSSEADRGMMRRAARRWQTLADLPDGNARGATRQWPSEPGSKGVDTPSRRGSDA